VAVEKVAAGAVATAGVEGAVVAGADLGPAGGWQDAAADLAAGSAGSRCPAGPRTPRQAAAAVHTATRAVTEGGPVTVLLSHYKGIRE
jgi:hypothetical protein